MGLGQGQIGTVLSAERITRADAPVTSIKLDMGGVTLTADQFQDGGTDSPPLPGDFVALLPTQRAGGHAVVAIANPVVKPDHAIQPQPGEHVIYSRNPDGEYTAELALTGEIILLRAFEAGNASPSAYINIQGGNDKVVIGTAGGSTITIDGATGDVVVNATNEVTVDAPTQVVVTSPFITLDGNCLLGGGGPAIARVGDTVDGMVTGGGSSHGQAIQGTITTGSAAHVAS